MPFFGRAFDLIFGEIVEDIAGPEFRRNLRIGISLVTLSKGDWILDGIDLLVDGADVADMADTANATDTDGTSTRQISGSNNNADGEVKFGGHGAGGCYLCGCAGFSGNFQSCGQCGHSAVNHV